jgi:hypothetical protein
MTNEIE